MTFLVCDLCGEGLDRYRGREIVSFTPVPTYRAAGERFDLCPACAEKLKAQLRREEVNAGVRAGAHVDDSGMPRIAEEA